MDEVTLVGAGLIGAGIAVLGVALVAGIQRVRRARVRPRKPPRRPGPRPVAPRPVPGRPAGAAPARVRPVDDAVRRPGPRATRTNAPRRPVAAPARALDGETLQLGPVPAWRLPVRPRNEVPAHRFVAADDHADRASPLPAIGPGVQTAHPGPAGSRADPTVPAKESAVEAAPASRELVSRASTFAWFMPGRS